MGLAMPRVPAALLFRAGRLVTASQTDQAELTALLAKPRRIRRRAPRKLDRHA
jgi:hypothetical protein